MAKPTFYQLQIERLREGYEAAMGNALKGKPNSFQYSIGYFVGRAVKGVRDAVISLAERISTLEAGANRRYPVHLGTAALAQADYQAAYEAAVKQPAGSIPPNGSTLVNLDNNHAITYFASAAGDKWIDRGADTVSMADNEGVLGAVTGSLEEGKASVNQDGEIIINGWDDLLQGTPSDISTNSQNAVDKTDKTHTHKLTIEGAVEYFTIASGAVRTVTGRPKMVYIRSWAGSKSDVWNYVDVSVNNNQLFLSNGASIGDSYSQVNSQLTLLVMPGDTYKVTISSSTYYNGDGVIHVYERSI